MANLEWRDRLRQELKKRNLPDSYSARFLEELTDHFIDIQKQAVSMDAPISVEETLGTPESLAKVAENEYRKRTYAGRHPFLVFALLPIPAVILALFAVLVPCTICKSWSTPLEPLNLAPPTILEWVVAYGSVYILRFVPFIIPAWIFMNLSRRVNRPACGMMACGLVAFAAISLRVNVLPPDGQHNLMICFAPEIGLWHLHNRFAQAAVPLALGIWKWQYTAHSHYTSLPSE